MIQIEKDIISSIVFNPVIKDDSPPEFFLILTLFPGIWHEKSRPGKNT